MATQDLAANALAARGTLAAATEDVVNFQEDLDNVEVATDGTADVYFSLDNTVPAAASNTSYRVPGTGSWNSVVVPVRSAGATKVRILAPSGTPKYEVSRA